MPVAYDPRPITSICSFAVFSIHSQISTHWLNDRLEWPDVPTAAPAALRAINLPFMLFSNTAYKRMGS
jgi:hypothetical protein